MEIGDVLSLLFTPNKTKESNMARTQVKFNDEDLLLVVYLLKRLVGNDKTFRKLLEKIDTPTEIARIRGSIQGLIDIVADL